MIKHAGFAAVLLAMAVRTTHADPVLLVEDGNARCVIVRGVDDNICRATTMERSDVTLSHPRGVLDLAAEALADHLNDMAWIGDLQNAVVPDRREKRVPVRVVDTVEAADMPVRILLGSAAIETHGLESEAATLGYWSYIYRTIGKDLVIFGSSSKGTANGIYGFLQDELGVRWYGPQELFRIVPRRDTIAIGDLDRRVEPDFAPVRYGVHGTHDHPVGVWAHRMRMGQQITPRGGHTPYFWRPHTMREILPPDRFGDRPELYALRGNTRYMHPSRFAVCYSNPEAADIAAEAAREWFRGSEHRHTFPMGINDAMAYCECENCSALQPERNFRGMRVASDMYYHFINEVARRVKPDFPDRFLAASAYNDATAPPLGPIEDNVWVRITLDISEYYDPDYRARDHELVEAWATKGVPLAMGYYSGLAKLVPAYFPRLLAEELSARHRQGFVTLGCEAYPGWPWRGPMHYAETRLWWDAHLDIDALLTEYFETLYGPAAAPMQALFERFEEIHRRPRGGGFLFEHYNFQQFRPYMGDDLAFFREQLDAAHAAIEVLGVGRRGRDNPEGQRVAYVSNGIKVFLDMLEGVVIARELEESLADAPARDAFDTISFLHRLEQVERLQTLLDRHVALYRETILSDLDHSTRYLHDTAVPVRDQWKKHLSQVSGHTLIGLHRALHDEDEPPADPRLAARFQTMAQVHGRHPVNAARYKLGIGAWRITGDNLAPNHGFETLDENGDPADWGRTTPVQRGEGYVIDTVEHDDPDTPFGARSARMKGIRDSAWMLTHARGIVPGNPYRFEIDAKLRMPEERRDLLTADVAMRVQWTGRETGWIRGLHTHEVRLDALNAWERLQITAVAPEGADRAAVFLRVNNMTGDEEAWFDNLSVHRIAE